MEALLDGLSSREKTEENYSCRYCGLGYETRSGRLKHEGKCSKLKEKDEVVKLREQVKKLQEENAFQKTHPQTINNTMVNNITVVVNDFGNEDISYIKDDKQFMDDCMKQITTAVRNVVEKIYFDKDHPENHTILMKNLKMNQVMIKEEGEWKRRHVGETIPKMVKKGRHILQTHCILEDNQEDNIDDEPDPRLMYLNELLIPQSVAHKNVVSMVKSNRKS